MRHLREKIRSAWASRTLGMRAKRYLATSLLRPVEVAFGYARLARADRNLDLASGFADHRRSSIHVRSQPAHLRRIRTAYLRAKDAQQRAPQHYRVRGLWAEWIGANYAPLVAALAADDLAGLSALLENHYRERFTMGTGGYDNFVRYRSLLGVPYIKCVWSRYRDRLAQTGFDLGELRFPCVGNPAGVPVNGSVITIDTLRHAYHAAQMKKLLGGLQHPVIAEIGGGLGGQAYQSVQLCSGAKYLVFDLPEVGVLSSYLLLTALPEKRVRLFGEAPVTGNFDIAVMPHFAVEELPDRSVDLFYNSCSFSEMDAASAQAYLGVVERACRGYFMHDNHDLVLEFRGPQGELSRNIIGSKLVPDGARFRRLYKKPRAHRLPEDRGIPHFEYLYQRAD